MQVAPALLVAGERGRRLLEQADRLEQDVVEVERPDGLEPGLVGAGEPGDDPLVVVEGDLLERVGVEHLVLRPADRAEDRRRPELPGGGQVLLAQELLHERLLVVGVVDHEARIEPDGGPIAPQDAGTDRVERPRLDVATGLADEGDDPLAELAGGAVRERHGQDLPRPDALHPDEVSDPMGEHAGLAAAGTGEDEQWSLGRGDGTGLLRVEPGDDPFGERCGRGRPLDGIDGRGGVAGRLLGRRRLLAGRCRQPAGGPTPAAARGARIGPWILGQLDRGAPGRLHHGERDVVVGRARRVPVERLWHASIVGRRASPTDDRAADGIVRGSPDRR